MIAEELVIVDADTPLWEAVQPLLEAALRLEQNEERYVWHGWNKQQIEAFLQGLPSHCTLVSGVWDTLVDKGDGSDEQEVLVLGCVCEVRDGEVYSIRTFQALDDRDLPSVEQLEPDFEHALKVMNVVKVQIAPVAWALFTDKATWDDWVFGTGGDSEIVDKGKVLAALARQGRCVLLGNQAVHHHLHHTL